MADRIIRSRWRRHGENPFGQGFAYTDAADLNPRPWYRRLFSRHRNPVGWAVAGGAAWPEAEIVSTGEVRISPIEVSAMVKVFDETVIITATEYEKSAENPNE